MVKFYTFTREKSVSWPNLEKDHVVIDWTFSYQSFHSILDWDVIASESLVESSLIK